MQDLIANRVKLPELQNNVWTEFAMLAMENGSINLGQGKGEQFCLLKFDVQECWAKSYDAYWYQWANSYGFSGKSFKLFL